MSYRFNCISCAMVALLAVACAESHTNDVGDGAMGTDGGVDPGPTPDGEACPGGEPALLAPFETVEPGGIEPDELHDVTGTSDGLVALASSSNGSPFAGLLYLDPAGGTVVWSELWWSSHRAESESVVGGGRVVELGPDRLAAILGLSSTDLSGTRELIVYQLVWDASGSMVDARELGKVPAPLEQTFEGFEDSIGVAMAEDRASVSYVAGDTLYVLSLTRSESGFESEGWASHGPLSTGREHPLPSSIGFAGDDLVAAGGGVPPRSPRAPFAVRIAGGELSAISLEGTEQDLPPLVVGGESPSIARHVAGASGSTIAITPLDGSASVHIGTGTAPPPLSIVSRDDGPAGPYLAWSEPTAAHPRATVVRLAPRLADGPAGDPLFLVPDGVDSPEIAATYHAGAFYVLALDGNPPRVGRRLVVWRADGCIADE